MNRRLDWTTPHITHDDRDHSVSTILCGRLIAGLMILVLSFAPHASATTITVTDPVDGGANTLRGAIAAASAGDTIDFNFSFPGTITLTLGEIAITKNLTITGPGASSLTVNANNASRVFSIEAGVTVNISGLTITGGNGAVSTNGGGIFNNGTLTLTNSTISGNTTALGGGIFNGGTALVTGSTIASNSATYGGGIYTSGTVTLINSTVSGNTAAANGGGFYVDGTLQLINATVSGNSAASAGGGFFMGG